MSNVPCDEANGLFSIKPCITQLLSLYLVHRVNQPEEEMNTYHNDPAVKAKYVNRMKAHIAADELVRGTGWESNGTTKGCAVGCTLHSYDHKAFETELGIPEWLARLIDSLHENTSADYLPNGVPWAQAFLEAVPVGADLTNMEHQVHIFIQNQNMERVESLDIDSELKQQVLDAINGVIYVRQRAIDFGWDAESEAWSAARSAARSAESAESAAMDTIADEVLRLLGEMK